MRLAENSTFRQLAALVLVSAAVAGCSKPQPPAEPIRAVKIVTVGLAPFQSGYEFSGEVRPRVETRLGFRVAGKITQRKAEPVSYTHLTLPTIYSV